MEDGRGGGSGTTFWRCGSATGVGGGMVLNGKMYSGGFLTAGEIGHMTLVPRAAGTADAGEHLLARRSRIGCWRRDRLRTRIVLKSIVENEKKVLLKKSEEDLKKKGKLSWQFENNKILRSAIHRGRVPQERRVDAGRGARGGGVSGDGDRRRRDAAELAARGDRRRVHRGAGRAVGAGGAERGAEVCVPRRVQEGGGWWERR